MPAVGKYQGLADTKCPKYLAANDAETLIGRVADVWYIKEWAGMTIYLCVLR